MRINRPNLIAWYDQTPDSPTPFPVSYDTQFCAGGSLVTYPGETTRFYLNPGNQGAVYFNPIVTLVRAVSGGRSYPVTHTFQIDDKPLGSRVIYGSINCPSVPPGLYVWQMIIGQSTIQSTPVEVLPRAEAERVSVHCEVRNPRTLQGIRYPWIDETFTQTARYRLALIDTPFPTESSSYREATTGQTVLYRTAADKLLSFRTGLMDSEMLESVQVMLLHETIRFNGQAVVVKDFLTTTPGRGKLSTGQFSVIDNSFATSLLP